jgi:hypothetical protein
MDKVQKLSNIDECCHLLGYSAVLSVCEPTLRETYHIHLQGLKSA